MMQKTDANPQSPTICRRLINFMLNMSLRPTPSSPIPVENGSSVHEERSFKSINNTLCSDIVVEFRHTDLEGDKASVHASKKGGLILGNESTIISKTPEKKEDGLNQSPLKKDGSQIQQKTGRKYEEKELQELKILDGTDARYKSLKTSNPVQESVDLPADQATKQKPARPLMPLPRVDSKINEKAEIFIQTTREAMSKSYHLDNN